MDAWMQDLLEKIIRLDGWVVTIFMRFERLYQRDLLTRAESCLDEDMDDSEHAPDEQRQSW